MTRLTMISVTRPTEHKKLDPLQTFLTIMRDMVVTNTQGKSLIQ